LSLPNQSEAIDAEQLLSRVFQRLQLAVNEQQQRQFITYFSLLLRWNQKINLTAIRKPEEIAARHFEESLFLAALIPVPPGPFVDIGSGAGFPGLPLKIFWQTPATVLLEPNEKKATFLKEVIRSCGLQGIVVREQRVEQAAELAGGAALVTLRAVAVTEVLLRQLKNLLQPDGQIALFVSQRAASQIIGWQGLRWAKTVPIPRSAQRVILLGENVC
jgi:16S rRNA (guanine527-N7)-methyltransferase